MESLQLLVSRPFQISLLETLPSNNPLNFSSEIPKSMLAFASKNSLLSPTLSMSLIGPVWGFQLAAQLQRRSLHQPRTAANSDSLVQHRKSWLSHGVSRSRLIRTSLTLGIHTRQSRRVDFYSFILLCFLIGPELLISATPPLPSPQNPFYL